MNNIHCIAWSYVVKNSIGTLHVIYSLLKDHSVPKYFYTSLTID